MPTITLTGLDNVRTTVSGVMKVVHQGETVAVTVAEWNALTASQKAKWTVVDGSDIGVVTPGGGYAGFTFSSYATKANLPPASANSGMMIKTADKGVYLSDGTTWQAIVDPPAATLELAYAEIAADFAVPISNVWTDVPGLQITVPANKPYVLELYTWFQLVQSTSPAGGVVEPQIRVMDLAAVNGFGYASVAFQFPTAGGGKQAKEVHFKRRLPSLAAATAMKVQARVGSGNGFTYALLTHLGNLPCFLRAEAR